KRDNISWRIFGLTNGLWIFDGLKTYCAFSGGETMTETFGSFFSVPSKSWLGCSTKSISPLDSALTACCASEIARHSTRSTLTTLPPDRADTGSLRGLYLSNLT